MAASEFDHSDSALVSIGLPTYNGQKTIERALQSLVEQTYSPIELVICDDVSTDKTVEVCERFAKEYAWIRFERNTANLGAFHNMIKTLHLSRGEYFVWADQEDYWMPEFVAALLNEFEKDLDTSAAMSETKVVYDDGGDVRMVHVADMEYPQNQSCLKNALSVVTKRSKGQPKSRTNLFIHGLMRRSDFVSAHEAFPGVPLSERQIVCQFALAGRLVCVERPLFVQTSHRAPISERRDSTESSVAARSGSFPRVRYMYGLAISVLRTKIVPTRRKWLLPIILIGYVNSIVLGKLYHQLRSRLISVLPDAVFIRAKAMRKRLRF